MSQHSSLKSASRSQRHRNVLKRYERIRTLQEREKWGDRKSVYRLPKLKMIKLKFKKIKEEKVEGEAETAAGGAPQSTGEKAGKPKTPKS